MQFTTETQDHDWHPLKDTLIHHQPGNSQKLTVYRKLTHTHTNRNLPFNTHHPISTNRNADSHDRPRQKDTQQQERPPRWAQTNVEHATKQQLPANFHKKTPSTDEQARQPTRLGQQCTSHRCEYPVLCLLDLQTLSLPPEWERMIRRTLSRKWRRWLQSCSCPGSQYGQEFVGRYLQPCQWQEIQRRISWCGEKVRDNIVMTLSGLIYSTLAKLCFC